MKSGNSEICTVPVTTNRSSRGPPSVSTSLPGRTRRLRGRHASAAETLDTYSQPWPDSDDRTRAAVDFVLRRVADSVRTGVTL